jgi:anhydro-N-acetylmuramic acid kinase
MPNIWINKLNELANKKHRIIIGLMSGTSLDGLDISLCKIEGFGLETKVRSLNFEIFTYSDEIKNQVRAIFSKKHVDLEQVCLQNEFLGNLYGDLVNKALLKWKIANSDVDLIASHGQTIYHSPQRLRASDNFGSGTLQIGDGDHIAYQTQIITISDFRQKHIAAGGEGAPLSVYGDFLLFKNNAENRIMLNIGGIANFTYLPAKMNSTQVFSTDVGPGNTMMDQFMQKHFNISADYDSKIALSGEICLDLLNALLKHSFFEKELPKTTGPELFNLNYLEEATLQSGTQHLSLEDQMATLNMFSAKSIEIAIRECFVENDNLVVYLSGGGVHNPLLINNLKKLLKHVSFKSINNLGINPDEKEAILFALLANETVCGSSLAIGDISKNPQTFMGKISLP